MLVLLGALRQETVSIEKCLTDRSYSYLEKFAVCRGKYNSKNVLLVLTGIGREMAEKATNLVLKSYPVKLLVSLGFAGALNPELLGGDIILCSSMHCAASNDSMEAHRKYSSAIDIVSGMCRALDNEGINFHRGDIVSVTQPVQAVGERATLRKIFNAEIVDMETYWIAAIAAYQQVPLIAVRAVSDTVNDSFPPIEQIVDIEGKLLPKKAVLHFLSHPWHLSLLPGLYRNSTKAAKNLSEVIKRLITIYEPG